MTKRLLTIFFLLSAFVLVGRAATDEVKTDALTPPGITVLESSWYHNTRPPDWDRPFNDATENAVDRSGGPSPIGTDNRIPTPAEGVTSTGQRTPSRAAENSRVASSSGRGGVPAVAPNTPPPQPQATSSQPLVRSRSDEYVYKLKFRNDGDKEINGVEWEYQFLDPSTGKELGRHQFQSFRKVKPGKSLSLEAISPVPPSRTVSAAGFKRGGRTPFNERILIRCVAYTDGSLRWHSNGNDGDCESLRRRLQERRQ